MVGGFIGGWVHAARGGWGRRAEMNAVKSWRERTPASVLSKRSLQGIYEVENYGVDGMNSFFTCQEKN